METFKLQLHVLQDSAKLVLGCAKHLQSTNCDDERQREKKRWEKGSEGLVGHATCHLGGRCSVLSQHSP